MLSDEVAYLLAQCHDNGIEASADDRGDILLDDARDEYAFRRLAGSFGWRSAGSGIMRHGRMIYVDAKQREPAERRRGYGAYSA